MADARELLSMLVNHQKNNQDDPSKEARLTLGRMLGRAKKEPKIPGDVRLRLMDEAVKAAKQICALNSDSFGSTPESRAQYLRDMQDWLAGGRELLRCSTIPQLIDVVRVWWKPERTYSNTSKISSRIFLTVLKERFLVISQLTTMERDPQDDTVTVLNLDETNINVPFWSPDVDPDRPGTKALKMVILAAKKSPEFKHAARARVELLTKAFLIAKCYQPPNWGQNPSERADHINKLEKTIHACNEVLNAHTWQTLEMVVREWYNPTSLFAAVRTETKGAKVFNFCVTDKLLQLCNNEARALMVASAAPSNSLVPHVEEIKSERMED